MLEKTSDSDEVEYYETDLNFKNVRSCSHEFVRIAATRVECIKCKSGYMDNGDFPLEDLNKYYQNLKN